MTPARVRAAVLRAGGDGGAGVVEAGADAAADCPVRRRRRRLCAPRARTDADGSRRALASSTRIRSAAARRRGRALFGFWVRRGI